MKSQTLLIEDFLDQVEKPKSNFSNKRKWLKQYLEGMFRDQKEELIADFEKIIKDLPMDYTEHYECGSVISKLRSALLQLKEEK